MIVNAKEKAPLSPAKNQRLLTYPHRISDFLRAPKLFCSKIKFN